LRGKRAFALDAVQPGVAEHGVSYGREVFQVHGQAFWVFVGSLSYHQLANYVNWM
jgi:hypothetical protein